MALETPSDSRTLQRSETLDATQRLTRGRWWKRSLLVLVLIAACASTAAWIATSFSPEESGPQLTHTMTRRDLLVSAVAQGMVESSENTEIKCKVRGRNTVLWVIESGAEVEPGDVLIRLDTHFIEEQIDERSKYAHWSRSGAERSLANVARAELAVSEYQQGRYVAELMRQEKDLIIAKAALGSAKEMLAYANLMHKSEYKSELDVEERDFAVKQARLDVALKETGIGVLKKHTREEQMQTLNGRLGSIRATHKANVERAEADASRRDRALKEIKHCVVRSERSGLVIHPSAAKWESAPIAEGSTVHKDQVLLVMPDLSKMQVKVGMHEAIIDRLRKGLTAKVSLPNKTLDGTVANVASVTKPAGWWTGNEVRYDTLIQLPSVPGLRPGMSAEVEVIIAEYEDVLAIPVAAIVESNDARLCWVKTPSGISRRVLELGDSNDVFTIVKKGLQEGDEVILNPLALAEARLASAKSLDESTAPPISSSK